MDLDDFEFNKVILKNIMVLNTLVTYFDKGVFGRPKLMRDLYNYFGSDVERVRVKEAHKEKNAFNEDIMVDLLLMVNSYPFSTLLFYPAYILHYFTLLISNIGFFIRFWH